MWVEQKRQQHWGLFVQARSIAWDVLTQIKAFLHRCAQFFLYIPLLDSQRAAHTVEYATQLTTALLHVKQRTMENLVAQGRERFCGQLSLLHAESLGVFAGQSASTQHLALFLVPSCSFPINQPPVALEIFKLSNFFPGFTTVQKFNNWF